jgi:hypothetical protein
MPPTTNHHWPIFPQGPLSFGEYSSHAELWSFSVISSKTLVLGHSSLSSRELGSPLGTVDTPVVKTFPLGVVLHVSLSPEDLIFQGRPPYLSSGQAFTMGVGPSQIPSDSPLGCLLANLGPLCLTPDLKPRKLIFQCNQAWNQYPLDNATKWPVNGTFNLNILRDLYISVSMLVNGRNFPTSNPFPISVSNPPSVLSVPLHRFY